MTEIFSEISQQLKDEAKFIFDIAICQKSMLEIVNTLNKYTNMQKTDEEREFVEFYFKMRMEQLTNGNFYDQR